jgi:hypothetical protein
MINHAVVVVMAVAVVQIQRIKMVAVVEKMNVIVNNVLLIKIFFISLLIGDGSINRLLIKL